MRGNTILDTEDLKQEIRKQMRAKRATMPKGNTRKTIIAALHKQILDAIDPKAKVIAGYVEIENEPPILEVLDILYQQGKTILLPKIGPKLQRDWAVYEGKEKLAQCAPKRPLEPIGDTLDATALQRADIILVPALTVDLNGHRIGQGGGWYDRALLHAAPSAPRMAILWDDEIASHNLLHEEHDVAMTHVITPHKFLAL